VDEAARMELDAEMPEDIARDHERQEREHRDGVHGHDERDERHEQRVHERLGRCERVRRER
jgi:hypothetical protein